MFAKLLLLALPLACVDAHKIEKRGVMMKGTRLWPKDSNGDVIIPYVLDRIRNPEKLKAIDLAIKDFDEKTCVQFVKKRRHTGHFLTITPDSSGDKCIGTSGLGHLVNDISFTPDNAAQLSIGVNCVQKRDILHELMHVMGIGHEHMRNDRTRHISVNQGAIRSDRSSQRSWESSASKIARAPTVHVEERTDNYPYDIHSLMHYARWSFARRGQHVFEAVQGGEEMSSKIGNSHELSIEDVDFLNHIYDCKTNKAGQPLTVQGPTGSFGPDPRDPTWNDGANVQSEGPNANPCPDNEPVCVSGCLAGGADVGKCVRNACACGFT